MKKKKKKKKEKRKKKQINVIHLREPYKVKYYNNTGMPLSGLVDKAVFRSVSDFINGQTFLIKARLTCINDSTHDLSIDAGKGLFNDPTDL